MIKIKAIEPRDENRQVAYFTTDEIEFSCGNVPADLTKLTDIKAYLESRTDEFRLLILRRQYPESDPSEFKAEGKTELESMQEWISKGHKNKVIIGYEGEDKPIYEDRIIEKKELEYKHPKWIGLAAEIEASNATPEMKEILKKIIKL